MRRSLPGKPERAGLQPAGLRVMRAEAGHQHEKRAQDRDGRDGGDRRTPVGPAQRAGEEGHAVAECQRTDEQADEKSAVALSPADRDLHADRVDAGQQRAR